MLEKNKDKIFSIKIFIAILLSLFLAFIRNFAFWSSSQTFIFGDTGVYSLYLASLAKNLIQIFNPKESLFLWNPSYLAVGLPTLSMIDTGFLYPPNILIALVANISGNPINTFPIYFVFIYLHIAVGAFFLYKILKEHWNLSNYSSLAGSFIWIFSGINTEFIAASSFVMESAYLPICVYLSFRYVKEKTAKNLFLLFLSLALSFLIGYPMISLITLFACAAIILFSPEELSRKQLVSSIKPLLVGIFLITVPIISPLYISSYMFISSSVRSSLTLDGFLENPAGMSDIFESTSPKNTPFNSLSTTNQNYLYFSLVGLIIVILAGNYKKLLEDKKNIIIFILGILGILFSLGKVTTISTDIYFLLPVANLFRRLSIFSILQALAFSILVAQGAEFLFKNKPDTKKIFPILFFVLMVAVVSARVISTSGIPVKLVPLEQSIGLTLIILSVTLFSLNIPQKFIKIKAFMIFFSLFLEGSILVSSRVTLNAQTNPAKVFGPNSLTANLQKIAQPPQRVDLLGSQNSYNTEFLGLEQTGGYLAMASKYGVYINDNLNQPGHNNQNLRNILGITYFVRKDSQPELNLEKVFSVGQNGKKPEFFTFIDSKCQWEPEAAGMRFSIYQNPAALKRVYLASRLIAFPQTEKALVALEILPDPRMVLLQDTDIEKQVSGRGRVEIIEYKRNYLKAKAENEEPAFLANATAYYPGWWVKVNGKLSKPIQANWFMMGTYLPPGKNVIEFFYIPYGIIIGGVYILVAATYWLVILRKNKKN